MSDNIQIIKNAETGEVTERILTEDELAEIRRPRVPHSITRAQAKLALRRDGKLAFVQPAIDAVEDEDLRQDMQIEWDERPTFERSSQTLIAIGSAIGYTSEDLDQLFIDAGAL